MPPNTVYRQSSRSNNDGRDRSDLPIQTLRTSDRVSESNRNSVISRQTHHSLNSKHRRQIKTDSNTSNTKTANTEDYAV
ncbi:hypothetical protein C481_01515 [Natrialba asiatica DSM 12278]|uniref:Uncharacterized protein n=1 Tax=Natrialba asiatica (strain ATCC 700177 / DSM 12278 / JCM 9576 / FERM P-10747 / NBRC 102637 / 172P1) TaxID=29540 RepID=M0B4P2_NATA1|nr:hypothetical protein C481_01515 [Natrialba asiatica DSM 12278]